MRLLSIVCLLSFVACDGTDDTETDLGTGTGDGTDMGIDTDTDVEGTDGTGDTGTTGDPDFASYADDILHNQSLASSQGSCSSSAFDVVYPVEGFENNYWAASRLVPDGDSFTVDAISIELYDDPSDNGCRTTTARTVRVAKQAGGDPAQRPSDIPGIQTYELTPQALLQRDYLLTEISPSITLSGADELWIFVQVESTSNGRTCLRGCQDDPQGDNNWFTSGQAGAAEPFSWRRLEEFDGITSTNFLIEAYELP
ncbi:MAG: hypothetical protein ACJAZO_001437 [Myxococcota bacterium]|jgi:hypothetical protein